MIRLTAAIAAVAIVMPRVASAEPGRDTLDAWNAYVGRAADRPSRGAASFDTELIDVPGGTIYRSMGMVIVRHTTVDQVLRALMDPGTPPPQEDVLESRVLSRRGDVLRVYLKLTRTAVVTVTYDTEHEVTFTRLSPTVATSRSVSTRIKEAGGGSDRGFLWRLNSYWRYTQVGDDVRIDVESLSLSRAVPRVARPVARPIIDRIGRESLRRTLASVRQFLESGSRRSPAEAL
jgi:hypothetical protein